MEQEFYKNGYCGLIRTYGFDIFCKLLIDQTPWLKHLTYLELTHLDLINNKIRDIAKITSLCSHLTHLNLSDNVFNDEEL